MRDALERMKLNDLDWKTKLVVDACILVITEMLSEQAAVLDGEFTVIKEG